MWELEDVLEVEIGSGLGFEIEIQPEPEPELATAVSLVVLTPIHLLVDPGGVELEIVEPHAGCLVELGGEWWSQGPPEVHDPVSALLEEWERCCH